MPRAGAKPVSGNEMLTRVNAKLFLRLEKLIRVNAIGFSTF